MKGVVFAIGFGFLISYEMGIYPTKQNGIKDVARTLLQWFRLRKASLSRRIIGHPAKPLMQKIADKPYTCVETYHEQNKLAERITQSLAYIRNASEAESYMNALLKVTLKNFDSSQARDQYIGKVFSGIHVEHAMKVLMQYAHTPAQLQKMAEVMVKFNFAKHSASDELKRLMFQKLSQDGPARDYFIHHVLNDIETRGPIQALSWLDSNSFIAHNTFAILYNVYGQPIHKRLCEWELFTPGVIQELNQIGFNRPDLFKETNVKNYNDDM